MAPKVATVEKSKPLVVTALPDERFEEAFTAATAKPADESPWERLEAAVVSDENQARQLLDFYRAHITADVPKPMLGVLSHRAVRFAADCFGENAPETIEVLRAVLKAAPDADWAFRPLVVALTMAERWREVLDAYDARLAVARRLRSPRRHPRGSGANRQGLHRRSRARGRLPRPAVAPAARGRSGRLVARALARTTRALGRAGRGAALPPGDARRGRRRASCGFASRPRCTRSSASPTRRSPRCASLLPDLHEDAPLARAARAPARRRARDARDAPRGARRPARRATRRPAPARACRSCC